MIERTVDVDAKWDCISNKGYISKPHLIKLIIRDEYNVQPIEDLYTWARRVAYEITEMMCKKACGSLSDSVFCNDIFPSIGTPIQTGSIEVICPESVRDAIKRLEQSLPKAKNPEKVMKRIEELKAQWNC